jgi:serine/threonine protein kinase
VYNAGVPASVLGRYRLLGRVAQGGMGEVWRGVDVGYGGIERPIAVKRISPLLAGDDRLRLQFLDEAKLSFLLCHQNVVQVRDIGEAEGDLYIAMEWVEGADLGTIMKRLAREAGQPLPLRFACLVAVEAARGLDYAHRLRDGRGRWLSLVHRDVSPSNLLCSFEGEIKVSDFGIARSRLTEQTSIPGSLKGKIAYMAPEQARGETLDARADLFALGAVLYEMLTAQNPFVGEAASEKEAIDRVREGRVRPLRQVVPTVPQGLEAIVLRAMAARREERYATLDQLREDLESFARREAHALSPSDFGHFLRDLLQGEPQRATEGQGSGKTITPVKRLSASRAVAAPRAFNDALGGALAALGSDDGDRDASGAPEQPRDEPLHKARTVALHRPIVVPPVADEPARPPTDLTDLVPRTRPTVPLVVAGGLGLLLVGGAVWLAHTPSAPTTPTAAATTPSAPAVAAPSPATRPPASARPAATVSAPAGERDHHKARAGARLAEAHLSIACDVAADAFVDGKYVQTTPIVDLPLAAGHHVVRVESTAAGLRLIPKEQSIDLSPGELRQLKLELK